ncbi:MAG: prolipoprotein diacylglyceryl transferase [Miltoncostaeaceae bacterium]
MIAAPATIPAPGLRSLELGPLDIRLYALCLLAGVTVAALITARRWMAQGGSGEVVFELTLVATAFGLVGGRLYHVITSYDQLGDEWYAPLAIWEGGLGIWGAIAAGAVAGAVYLRRRGLSVPVMLDAAAPGVLIAQGIGRMGNYFNQELFGSPSTLPWALEVDPAFRPDESPLMATYHPTFLYEMVWNIVGAAALIVLGRRVRIAPPGIFCLYVAVYSLGRIFWEQLRVDPSQEFLGQRLNFYVALALFLGAMALFAYFQRRAGDTDEPGDGDGGGAAAPAGAAAGGATAARVAAARRGAAPAAGVPRTPGGRAKPTRPKRR